MTNEKQLKEQINAVVDARQKVREANLEKVASYNRWVEANQTLLDDEDDAKAICRELEAKLRELAVATYLKTLDKVVAPGVGIRSMTRLEYDNKTAMDWAEEHKLALKLDTATFEKIAKTSNLSFVTFSEEPQATIATVLAEID